VAVIIGSLFSRAPAHRQGRAGF